MISEVIDRCHDLELPDEATTFLATVWQAIQGLDDWVDGTPVERETQDMVIWTTLIGLNSNPFFMRHCAWLQPLIANQVLKWQAADYVERNRLAEHYPKAYMWRAGYYDLVLQVVLLVHGPSVAMQRAPAVMALYAESYADYVEEFSHA